MTRTSHLPSKHYGVLNQEQSGTAIDQAAEQIKTLGYAILDSGYTKIELNNISDEFNRARQIYIKQHGEEFLKSVDEINTVRAPLTFGGEVFLNLIFNPRLQSLVKKLIRGKFILNQQNGVINPPQKTYNQGAWHRDLPYQHFVSSTPLAINALFCVDDFTFENGGTFVLPASQKTEAFPSDHYVRSNAVQVEAKAGSYIVLDCMMFHAGGYNKTTMERRAVNHVFNIPFFKQQINIPKNMDRANSTLTNEEKEVLGYAYDEPSSTIDYLAGRGGKQY